MRIVVSVFALAALAGSAFAVSELRALRQVAVPPPAPVAEEPREARPAPLAETPALSTWRGALPFGAVPAAPPTVVANAEPDDVPEVSDSHAVLDEVDRCPDDGEGDEDLDGCPDVKRIVTEDGRVLTVSHSIIIIHNGPAEAGVTIDGAPAPQVRLDRIIY